MRRLALAVFVVALVAAGVHAWIAREAERRYEQAVASIAFRDRLTLAPARYERDWWGATATTRVTVVKPVQPGDDEAAEPISFDLRHVLRYGPVTTSGVGVAVIETAAELPEAMRGRARPPIGETPLLDVHTLLEFGGGTTTRLGGAAYEGVIVPPRGGEEVRIAWAGAEGTIRTAAHAAGAEGDARVPSLSVESPGFALRFHDLTVRSAVTRAEGAPWLGSSALALGGLAFRIAGRGGEPARFDLEGLSTTVERHRAGEGIIEAGSTATLRSVTFGATELTEGEIRSTARRLDEASLSAFEALSSRVGSASEEEIRGAALDLFRHMLQRSPEITIEPARLQSASGPISARASLGFDGEGYDAGANPFWLLVRSRALAEIDLPDDILKSLLGWKIRSELAAEGTGDIAAGRLQALVAAQLAELESDGLVTRHEGRSKANVTFEKGKLSVNGHSGEALLQRALEGALRAL